MHRQIKGWLRNLIFVQVASYVYSYRLPFMCHNNCLSLRAHLSICLFVHQFFGNSTSICMYVWTLRNDIAIKHADSCMQTIHVIDYACMEIICTSMLTEVCPNVAIKPHLQPLSRETFRLASANTDDGARLDVRARGFWNARQDAFFDVRVFRPNAPSYSSRSLSAAYKKHEDEKIWTSVYLKSSMASSPHLYFQHQEAWEEKHKPSTNAWLTCFPSNVMCPTAPPWRYKLSFAILRSAVMGITERCL